MEATARHMIASGFAPVWAYGHLASALAARGRPVSTVREALRQAVEGHEGQTAVERAKSTAWAAWTTAALAGDLDEGEKQARAYEKLIASSLLQEEHGAAALRLAQLLEEQGRAPEAGRIAVDFLDRRDAWEPNASAEDMAMGHDATPSLLLTALRGGRLTRPEVAARRGPWLDGWSARVTPVARNFLWPHAWTRAVDTAEDAREALAAQPKGETLPPFSPDTPLAAYIGRTFLLGGRVDEALQWLGPAAQRCDVLEFPVDHTRSQLWLGQAKEAKGDTAGACAAYQAVLDRWGKAKPKSVTAEKARERGRALRCTG
jgi:serine/threonine-protein kinase